MKIKESGQAENTDEIVSPHTKAGTDPYERGQPWMSEERGEAIAGQVADS